MPTPYKLLMIEFAGTGDPHIITVGIFPATVDPTARDASGNLVNAPIASFAVPVYEADGDGEVISKVQAAFVAWTQQQASLRALQARATQYVDYVLSVTDETT